MKAVAVIPGQANSMHEVPNSRGVLVQVLRVGVDGVDKEINAAENCVDFKIRRVHGTCGYLSFTHIRRLPMKKVMLSVVAIMCLVGFSSLSFAADMGEMKDKMKGEMKEKGMKDEMKGEMKGDKMGEMKGDMKGDKMGEMKGKTGEMKEKMGEMKGEMKGKMGEMGK